jgi:hypothetical protein
LVKWPRRVAESAFADLCCDGLTSSARVIQQRDLR